MTSVDLVTGAFGFTGSRIASRLVAFGRRVRTLTRRVAGDHLLAGSVDVVPYDFSEAALRDTFRGVDTAYVTYWMRFPRGEPAWDQMIGNVARMADAAAEAGVRRMVYISVANAAHDASTAYFRAKAAAEDAVRAAAGGSLSVAIVRPTLLFGEGDILINNMAWTLRRLPVFGIPGSGNYRVQPVLVDDVADLCIRLADGSENVELTAAGPEALSFNELVRTARGAVRSRALMVHLPVPLVLLSSRVIGIAVRDVVLTRDEIRELSESLLVSGEPAATCPTRFSDWIAANADAVGRRWSSELARNFRQFQCGNS